MHGIGARAARGRTRGPIRDMLVLLDLVVCVVMVLEVHDSFQRSIAYDHHLFFMSKDERYACFFAA